MSVRDCFDKLGISPTRDKKEIKKAYGHMAVKYHPEEYPEQWKEIHTAYKEALAYAGDHVATWPENYQTDFKKSIFDNKQTEPVGEYDDLFQAVQRQDENIQDLKTEILNQTDQMRKNLFMVSKKDWMRLFVSDAYDKCYKEESVVNAVLTAVKETRYSFSSMEIIYDNLELLMIILQGEKEFDLSRKVKNVLGELEFRWNLSVKNKKRLRKRPMRMWKLIQTYWNIPVWWRIIINQVLFVYIPFFWIIMSLESAYREFEAIPVLGVIALFYNIIFEFSHKNHRKKEWRRR